MSTKLCSVSNRCVLAALTAGAAALALTTSAHASTTVTVDAADNIYNTNTLAAGTTGASSGENAPQSGYGAVVIDVTGLSSITFSNVTATWVQGSGTAAGVTLNGGTLNDPDGVGSASGENISSLNDISGIQASTAGFLAGVFVGSTTSPTAPTGLDFTSSGLGTSFSSLNPLLQQAFFIGDGLTGDGTGGTQTFYVPTGATTLYLGVTDACGYSGAPNDCYTDNEGYFTVTTNGAGVSAPGGVPEPATWAMMLVGIGGLGAAIRRRRTLNPETA
jgi:PEP-CTERM motif